MAAVGAAGGESSASADVNAATPSAQASSTTTGLRQARRDTHDRHMASSLKDSGTGGSQVEKVELPARL